MRIIFQQETLDAMQKAFGKQDLAKLRKEIITDKNGHKKTVYKKVDKKDDKHHTTQKKDSDVKSNTGTSKYSGSVGDLVNFTVNDSAGERILSDGRIAAIGNDGVIIRRQGVEYRVLNKDIGRKQRNSDGTIPASAFNANDYKKSFTDPKCTNDADGIKYIYSLLGEEGRTTQAMVEKKLNEQSHRMKYGDTQIRNMHNIVYDENGKFKSGEWNDDRKKLHDSIIRKILAPEKVAACIPNNGEKPKFVMFGGRGGSGKSWFTDKERAAKEGREVMFNSDKFLILDADEIKKALPEFNGWNAGEVHEESSYLMKEIKKRAMANGLNIIIDGTMNFNPKKPDKVRNEMLEARSKGYILEAHYMFTPIQKSCINAMNRFKTNNNDYSGRLVPTDILLGMQDNEKSFDSVKDIVDDWTFRDNQNFEAKLISRKGL